MNKLILTVILAITALALTPLATYSQSLKIVDVEEYIFASVGDYPEGHAAVVNVSDAPVNVLMSMKFIEKANGHKVGFCMGECLAPTDQDITMDSSVEIAAGDSTKDLSAFHSMLDDGGNSGVTTVQFTFYVQGKPDDKAVLTVTYNVAEEAVEQSLECISNEYIIYGDKDNEIKGHANIKNVTENTVNVYAKMTYLERADGHAVGFCMGVCIAPSTDDIISEMPVALAPGEETETEKQFYAMLVADNDGVTRVRFEMNVEGNEDDVLYITMKFIVGNDISVFEHPEDIMTVYPNPATDIINFDFGTDLLGIYTLNIYDINGKVISSRQISNASSSVNTSAMPVGNYMYEITNGSLVVNSGTLVINR